MNKEILEEITALVDKEIKDPARVNELFREIENDPMLKFEYNVQLSTKNLLSSRFANQKAPEYLTESIRSQIFNEIQPAEEETEKTSVFAKLKGVFLKPGVAFAFSLAVSLIIFLTFPVKKTTPVDLASLQKGSLNMFVLANNNFEKIIQGTMPVQFSSSDPQAVKEFLKSQGVNYDILIPQCPSWKLKGACVSEQKGEKFAHHVYTDSKGKVLYIFQVNEGCLKKKKSLALSSEMLDYIDKGNFFRLEESDHCVFLFKEKKNIIALVSNEALDNVENNFLTQLK